MRRSKSPLQLSHRWQWLPLPVLVGSGVGYGIVLVQEEVELIELLPLAALPGLAGVVYLLDHFIFKARLPRPENGRRKPPVHNDRDSGML